MVNTKKCERCKKEFRRYQYRPSKFCSMDCYLLSRWGTKECQNCGNPSKIRYCSVKCRKDYWNKNDYKIFKKKYHWDKKIEIVKELGGKCVECGNEDMRVLDINHIDRKLKKIAPKRAPKRAYTWSFRLKEWRENMGNLELLCANCHRIHTWKQMNYGKDKPIVKI